MTPENEGASAPGAPSIMRRLLTGAAVVAAVFFVLAGIGSPLAGRAVFAGTDEIARYSPYADAGLAGTKVQNTLLNDTYDAALPAELLFADEARLGEFAAWNPYIAGGTPLGAVPNYAVLSPLSLPYYVLPGWLAPGYQKLLELGVAIVGSVLFLRRLRLSHTAAILGGIVFASSAFLVMWTNWPQTRVAALIGWVFWAAERLVQRRTVANGVPRTTADSVLRTATDAVLLALPVGFMLLGGFPAVTAFTLLTALPYLVVRAVAEHRGRPRRLAGVLLGALAALAGGAALAAVQLLPFGYFYRTWLIEGRAQTGADHLGLAELATSFAPWAFGGVSQRTDQPGWYLPHNMVEASSYVGAAALVLAVVAVAASKATRSFLPRGAWACLVAATLSWLLLIYSSWPLSMLQRLPVFDANFIGRARSVLGFLLAVLAALGLEVLLHRRQVAHAKATTATATATASATAANATSTTATGKHSAARPAARPRPMRPVLIVLAAAGLLVAVTVAALRAAEGATARPSLDPRTYATGQLRLGAGLIAIAAGAVLVLLLARRLDPAGRTAGAGSPAAAGGAAVAGAVLRSVGVVVLLALVVGQGLSYVQPYWPRVDRQTFYPRTDTHDFLAGHLGHERYAGTTSAMYMGLDAHKRLRALSGHAFVNAELAALLRAVPGNAESKPTHVLFSPHLSTATSPILDRLGVRYFVTSPRDPIFGTARISTGDSEAVTLRPGATATGLVTTAGPLRAIGIIGTAPVAANDVNRRVDVVVTDEDGTTLARGGRLLAGFAKGEPFWIPIAGEKIATGTRLEVAVTSHATAPLRVEASAGRPRISTVTAPQGGMPAAQSLSGSQAPTADDGLQLVYAGSAVVWQRLRALPRIRWATTAKIEPDPDRRVALLESGALDDDAVLLNAEPDPEPPAGTAPAGTAAGVATPSIAQRPPTNGTGEPAQVWVDHDGTDAISVRVSAPDDGHLVIADALQSGWTATVDDRPARLISADQGVVAVAVTAGNHTVELRYVPPYRNVGGWLSLAAALLAAVLLIAGRRGSGRGRTPDMTVTDRGEVAR